MNEQFEKMMTPFKELNALAIENAEKFVDIQIKAIEQHSKLGTEQLKQAASIKDVDGLRDYMNKQADVIKQFADRTVADTQAVVELGNNYSAEVQRVMQDAMKNGNGVAKK